MKTKSKPNPATPAYNSGKRTVKRSKTPVVRPDEDDDAWAWADSEQDSQALIKLSEFLSDKKLRSNGSSCQDAIDAIVKLEAEVKRLKTALEARR